MTEILSLTCSCHHIDPNKFPILVWMRNNRPLVKIANQMFIGQTRTDKNGETYWKCQDLTEIQPKTEQVNNFLTNQDGKPNNSAESSDNS